MVPDEARSETQGHIREVSVYPDEDLAYGESFKHWRNRV